MFAPILFTAILKMNVLAPNRHARKRGKVSSSKDNKRKKAQQPFDGGHCRTPIGANGHLFRSSFTLFFSPQLLTRSALRQYDVYGADTQQQVKIEAPFCFAHIYQSSTYLVIHFFSFFSLLPACLPSCCLLVG